MPLYYAYFLSGGNWAPLAPGAWLTTDQLMTAMSSAPSAQYGGYVWDGQTMRWQSLSTYR